MFDTMTLTKIVGAFCGAFLIFLLGKSLAEDTYHVGAAHGHGDGEHKMGYLIEVEDSSAPVEEVDAVPFGDLLAAADLGKGEKVFGKCRACHKLEDGANGTGPHLYGVVDRNIAAVDGFGYSGNLIAVAEVWTPENLDGFLENPKGWAPGTKMSFAGLKKPEDRANLIAYLDSLDD